MTRAKLTERGAHAITNRAVSYEIWVRIKKGRRGWVQIGTTSAHGAEKDALETARAARSGPGVLDVAVVRVTTTIAREVIAVQPATVEASRVEHAE